MENNKINFSRYDGIEIVKGTSFHAFPKHSHKSFCIGIIIDGKAKIKIMEQDFILEQYNVFFIPPFTEHSISAFDKYSYIAICIYDEFAEKYAHTTFKNYIITDKKTGIKLLKLSDRIIVDFNQVKNAVQEIIADNMGIWDFTVKAPNTAVKNAADYISEHLCESFSLEKLAEYTHITKYHLLRIFKFYMGIPPHQFYIQEKIKKIRQELLKEQSSAVLAHDYSFSDQSHLCNTFKKHVGLTLDEFKKSYTEFDG